MQQHAKLGSTHPVMLVYRSISWRQLAVEFEGVLLVLWPALAPDALRKEASARA